MAAAADPSHLSSLVWGEPVDLDLCHIIAAPFGIAYGAPPSEPPAVGFLQCDPHLLAPPPPAAVPVPLHEENRVSQVSHNLDFSGDPFYKGCQSFLNNGDKRNCIVPVRDQGKTNSCYAFVVVNTIAAAARCSGSEAAEGELQDCHGSAQELLDRLHLFYRPSGEWRPIPDEGLPNNFGNAFEYAKTEGLSFEAQYKWVGRYQPDPPTPLILDQERIYIEGYKTIDHENHEEVVERLKIQPLAAAITIARSFYTWGFEDKIYEGPSEEEKVEALKKGLGVLSPNHAVTLVGYGGEEGIDDYYLCQNSFGTDWGHHGYFKVRRHAVSSICYPVSVYTARKNRTENNDTDAAESEDSDDMDID